MEAFVFVVLWFTYISAPAVHQRLGVYQQLGLHSFASREIRQVMPHP